MKSRRLILALLIALFLSLGVTLLVSHRMSARPAPRPVTVHRYVAVAKALQAGEALKPDNLIFVDWPDTIPLPGAFAKVDDVSGRSIIYPVAERQPILANYLAAAGSGIGITAKIPDGMRATSVRSDEVVGVAGFLFPGSHVDVLVTYHPLNSVSPATQIVLQDVEVLTAGQNIQPDPQGKPVNVSVVTLLLTPQDAERVVLAANQGTIHFVLRNGSDRGLVKPVPVELSALSGAPAPSAASAMPHRIIAPKPSHIIETIMGEKRMTAAFE